MSQKQWNFSRRPFARLTVRVVIGWATVALVLIASAGLSENPPVVSGARLNRVAPKIESPQAELKFSANPTEEEISRARVFEEPLVVVGDAPSAAENAALTAALSKYAKRSGPDDFSALTDFLAAHPQSSWAAALLTDLGLDYYHTAHYSLALDAWTRASALSANARTLKAIAVTDRAKGELLLMHSRLGHMEELQTELSAIGKGRLFGPGGERVVEAREALWNMQNHPEISFRCGPLALRSIAQSQGLPGNDQEILKSASTQQGCSLKEVEDLSGKIGLNYQMAFREQGEFVVPALVHWKVGHYAALIRKVGDLYELHDPTFGNSTWATKQALAAETSGYFLVAAGSLPSGWRTVSAEEGSKVWGKGLTGSNDPRNITPSDLKTSNQTCHGMAVAAVHMMDVNLTVADEPEGYAPPIGPRVACTVRYNQRDVFQPGNFNYNNLGPQWTTDWYSYITDTPSNQLADVNLYVGGGGERTYTGFNTNTSSFAYQQYDQSLLIRTGANTYTILMPNGSQMVYNQPDGSIGSTRKVYLTQMIDPQGNAITFTYDVNLCLVAVTDAIGQVTTLTYGLTNTVYGSGDSSYSAPADPYKLTKITDPFGRSATFTYKPIAVYRFYEYYNGNPIRVDTTYGWALDTITDVAGLTSQFGYVSYEYYTAYNQANVVSYVNALVTPYGTNSFFGDDLSGNSRFMEITFPDGTHERVEYNQTNSLQALSDPVATLPAGVNLINSFLLYRDTYFWDRNAYAQGHNDYSKARLYHFQHTENLAATAGTIESIKAPLENRVWYDYPGASSPVIISSFTKPAHIGRVLDDGSTQLYSMAYNFFGHLTNSIDPLGRMFNFNYAANGIDLLEIRQTRKGASQLLAKATYNSQHQPLTVINASGQMTTYTYNGRGQVLTATDAKNETTTFNYNSSGYLVGVDGPLPGANDTVVVNYDGYGRVGDITDVSGYRSFINYDNLDRPTRVTHPDGTFSQFDYDRLDCSRVVDRAGRQTLFDHDSMRQMTARTDALGRVTRYEWCSCGGVKSMTDPMGRTTSWMNDLQGRRIAQLYPDGSKIEYRYNNTISRLAQVIDEKQQSIFYTYNTDNTLRSITYNHTLVPTPGVSFTYDPDYERVTAMTDGIGTTTYTYNPVDGTGVLGAGALASIVGPLPNEVTTYAYDELNRAVQMSMDGVAQTKIFDAAGRVTYASNALGAFNYTFDGSSGRIASMADPNGLTAAMTYGNFNQDLLLQQVAYTIGANPVSKFSYGYDYQRLQTTSWGQQAGAASPSVFSFGYDAVNQLLSAVVTNAGVQSVTYNYSYDPSGNRLSEQVGANVSGANYNALNQLTSLTSAAANLRTNEWDGQNRLTAVVSGSSRTEFAYDGLSRLAYIRHLQSGTEDSFRRFVWNGRRIFEERDKTGAIVTKRFLPQGVELETGANAGKYFYTLDHLGSIRELTDSAGTVRARYAYDPFGRRTKTSGDLDADFGFTGMFYASEASLDCTHFRFYDPQLGRWLSRDPIGAAALHEGPNLYAYVHNEPVNRVDPEGLCEDTVTCTCLRCPQTCQMAGLVPALQSAATVAGTTTLIVEESGCPENAGEDITTSVEACENLADTVVTSPIVQSGNTLPGIGPDTITGLENTGIQIAQQIPNLRDAAILARRLDAWNATMEDPAQFFWQNWMDLSRNWRMDVLTSEQNQQVVMWISRWTDSLFSR